MQQEPLVAGTDLEQVTHLVARESFHVAQHDDLPLARRQIFKPHLESRRPRRRLEAILTVLGPTLDGIGPLPASVEADRIDRTIGLCRGMTLFIGASGRARLIRIRNSHVLRAARPSKRSMPLTTPIQVSCTASSVTARLGT